MPVKSQREIQADKINLGCGPDVFEGWLGIDKSPSVWLAGHPFLRRALYAAKLINRDQAEGWASGIVYADLTRRIPVPDNSASFVYNSHVIEHLSQTGAAGFLSECARILKPDGVLRIATPDLEMLVEDYKQGTSPHSARFPNRADAFCAEYGAFQDIDQGNRLRRFLSRTFGSSFHQWLYDFESLSARLREAGFTRIERCEFRRGKLADLDLVETRERSLFVEAQL